MIGWIGGGGGGGLTLMQGLEGQVLGLVWGLRG